MKLLLAPQTAHVAIIAPSTYQEVTPTPQGVNASTPTFNYVGGISLLAFFAIVGAISLSSSGMLHKPMRYVRSLSDGLKPIPHPSVH